MATDEERIEEEKKVRQLQRVADFACCVLHEQTFDLIYGARLRRILIEKFPIS